MREIEFAPWREDGSVKGQQMSQEMQCLRRFLALVFCGDNSNDNNFEPLFQKIFYVNGTVIYKLLHFWNSPI